MSHVASPESDLVERVLRHSQLDAGAIEQSHRSFKKHLEQKEKGASPAGWHGASDIATLEGLGGDYLWTADPLHPSQIRFQFDAGHIGNQGTYRLVKGLGIEEGVFYSVPNNPAIGWASIVLLPNGGAQPQGFTVAGMLTDAAWKIWILMLNKMGPSGPIEPAFSSVRFF